MMLSDERITAIAADCAEQLAPLPEVPVSIIKDAIRQALQEARRQREDSAAVGEPVAWLARKTNELHRDVVSIGSKCPALWADEAIPLYTAPVNDSGELIARQKVAFLKAQGARTAGVMLRTGNRIAIVTTRGRVEWFDANEHGGIQVPQEGEQPRQTSHNLSATAWMVKGAYTELFTDLEEAHKYATTIGATVTPLYTIPTNGDDELTALPSPVKVGRDEREAFVQWYSQVLDNSGHLPIFHQCGDGYIPPEANYAWGAWRARATLMENEPSTLKRDIEQQVRINAELATENEVLRNAERFAGAVLKDHRNISYPGNVDGGWLQDMALECGLIEQRTVSGPCGESCTCAVSAELPSECYFITEAGRACIDAANAAAQRDAGTGEA